MYHPRRAWLKALAYFCACLLAAQLGGVLDAVFAAPLASDAQRADPLWWAMTAVCWTVILVGYGVIWPIGTFTDGRVFRPVLSTAYGAVWGACQGLWFLTVWTLISRSGLSAPWVAALSWLAIGGYNGLYHRFFWDIHVSPPHNYSEWNARKVLFCHTPNLIVCLAHLAMFGDFPMFVLLQSTALAISACVMRFPAWWDDYRAVAGAERPLAEKPA